MGDAAHSITPFYGQGLNAGLEDVTCLSQLIDKFGDNWKIVCEELQKIRKPNTDAIGFLANQNFREIRDLIG